MLREIYEIGKNLMEKRNISDVELFLDKPKLEKSTKWVILLVFKIGDTEKKYTGTELVDYRSGDILKYLYKSGSPNGPDVMSSSLITKPETTLYNKIKRWFEQNVTEDMPDALVKIREILMDENEYKKILNDLKKTYENLDKKERSNILLTIKIIEKGKEKYLGDYQELRGYLIEKSTESYYFKKSLGESKGEGVCYLCGKKKEVYGYVLPAFGFSFSTADKPGFIGDFKSSNTWKEIPICKDCAIALEVGKKYLDENLSFPFYGNRYYVIPQMLLKDNVEEVLDELLDNVEYYKGKKYNEGLVNEEDRIEEFAIHRGNIMKLIFVFYKQKGGGKFIDILKYVENVLPSYLGNMLNAIKEIKQDPLFGEETIKKIFGSKEEGNYVDFAKRKNKNKGIGDYNWYIPFSRNFLGRNKEFLDFVSKVLTESLVDRKYMISKFIDKIREEFRNKNDYAFKMRVFESFMLYEFMSKLKILRGENMGNEKETKTVFDVESLNKFFKERESTFETLESKAAFLVGALINYVLQVQRTERGLNFGDEPFRAKLYSLNLDEKKIKKIFTEAVEKLSEYRRGGTTIEKLAADYLTQAGNEWKLSKDEISYYFSLGMVLGTSLFLKEKEKKEVDKDGNKE